MAYIVPQKFLLANQTLYSNYHLLLAQELLQLSKQTDQASYTRLKQFWTAAQLYGHFIMLDNGAYEMGAAMDDEQFIQVTEQFHPNEIILPDVMQDANTSMERAQAFCIKYKEAQKQLPTNKRIDFAAVIQVPTDNGQEINMEDIHKQFMFYHYSLGVRTICIPKHFGHGRPFGRANFAEKLHQFLTRNTFWLEVFNFHFLGLACIPELLELSRYFWVRGVDTAAPFVFATYGALIGDSELEAVGKLYKRPDNFFEIDNLKKHAYTFKRNVVVCNKMLRFGRYQGRYTDNSIKKMIH